MIAMILRIMVIHKLLFPLILYIHVVGWWLAI